MHDRIRTKGAINEAQSTTSGPSKEMIEAAINKLSKVISKQYPNFVKVYSKYELRIDEDVLDDGSGFSTITLTVDNDKQVAQAEKILNKTGMQFALKRMLKTNRLALNVSTLPLTHLN